MRRYTPFLKWLCILLVLAGSSATLVGSGIFLYLNPKLPPIDELLDAKLQIPLRIYSQNGELIGEFGEKFRTPVSMQEVPEDFIHAILAAEDDRFLKHRGIDIAGLLRAASQLLLSGEIRSGGSTITMQVARNFFLSREQTFVRKFNEIFLALKIERMLGKDEILELYINKIYLGKRAYGIQAAAAVYYGKTIDQLSLAQLAMIAGLPKAPSAYNPVNNPSRALVRRNWILGRMHKLGFIDTASWQSATQEPVSASYHGPKLQLDAGYAAEMARTFAVDKFGLAAYTDGLQISTTIDGNQQRSAQNAVTAGLDEYTQRHGYRGPEQRLAEHSEEQLLAVLRKLHTVNGLIPAAITQIEVVETNTSEQHSVQRLTLLLNTNQTIALDWNPEQNPLRPFITENRRGRAIEDISELLSVGDIIRIRYNAQGAAEISQLPSASASLIALRPHDGAITAMVGGYDFQHSKFNRATQAYRQPGSNFKPFIYAAALEHGYTAASVINDAPIVFSDDQLETEWRPENSSGKFYGPTTLRRALYLSRNMVSVRLLRELGIGKAIHYLEQFDLGAGPLPRDLSLALGSHAITPLQVARLYAAIANGGYNIEPYIVTDIRDRNGQLLYRANPVLACDDCEMTSDRNIAHNARNTNATPFEEAESLAELMQDRTAEAAAPIAAERIIDERVAFILDSILQDVIQRGTGTKARAMGRSDLAGKTGTTNGPTDAWFSGYHPELVATTWLGFDDNQLLGRREFGSSAALPIWMTFMNKALQNKPVAGRKQPAGLKAVKIDRLTGQTPTATTTQTLFEKFREEYAPDLEAGSANPGKSNRTDLHEDLF